LRAPKVILNSNKSLQKSFIAGLFDADGGIRGRNIGFTMKNKDFMLDIKKLLLNLSINASEDSWFNKKYKRNYYGLRLNKQSTAKFLKIIPVSNTEKLKRVYEHTNLIFAGQRD
jgi:intein/homing endonuclease